LLFCAAAFCGCGPANDIDYVQIGGIGEHGEYEQEKNFVKSFFGEGGDLAALGLRLLPEPGDGAEAGGDIPRPALFIEFLSYWEHEAAFGDVLFSKTFLVPREDPLAGRTTTSFAACLEGQETLVPPGEIAPPFVALRVDGLALGDEGYPLVRAAGIRVGAGDEKPPRRLRKKTRQLGETLAAARKPPAVSPRPVWIAAGGDLMLDELATEILFREGPAAVFGDTAAMLSSSDLALVNLEGVVSSLGEKISKSFNFRFHPEIAPALRAAGIDVVLHANNHVFDYGREAFLDSLSRVAQAGIGIVGAGLDDDAASEPFVFRRGEETFRVFGLGSFYREWNGWDGAVAAAAGPGKAGLLHARRGGGGLEKLKSKVLPDSDASPEGDVAGSLTLDIILFHGGTEWSIDPDVFNRRIFTELLAAGADVVIGSHPHKVQGFEWVLGKPVFWSLGNYVFGGEENNIGEEEGLFIRLGFWQGRLLYLEPFALILSHTRSDIAPPEMLEAFYDRSRELRQSNPIQIVN